jgi:putative alpha-1,2-mannosidase
MAALINMTGGPTKFIRRLNHYHETKIAYIGDEQAFLNVFLYHYAGRPGLSSARAHYYIPRYFHSRLDGIPGNDDSGAMGSFAALTMMGVFPNAGQNVYFLTPPFFAAVNITSRQTGRVARIVSRNFDPGYKNIYIQSATLNGKPYTRNWISHDFFAEGGTLEYVLGPKESDWGTAEQDLPPSLSTTGFAPRTVVNVGLSEAETKQKTMEEGKQAERGSWKPMFDMESGYGSPKLSF